jgi:GAF domain-containing protein
MPDDSNDEVVRVAELFADVARSLAAPGDLQGKLDMIVNLAVEQLDACEFAGMSLVVGRNIGSPASSNDVPRIVDAIQTEVNEGPCLDAIREHEVFQTGDLPTERRWPKFATRAFQETGVRSILALRLFVEEDTMGALNLYATAPDAFDETDVALASVFAAHAGIAMASGRRAGPRERRGHSRDLIGRAKGILMAQSKIDDEGAFDLLRRASQRLNIKLVDVAEKVIHPGEAHDPVPPELLP